MAHSITNKVKKVLKKKKKETEEKPVKCQLSVQ